MSEIAKFDPHSAYTAFTAALRHRYTFFMRTISDIGPLMKPVEAVIREKLIPALTEDRKVTDDERLLMSLPPKFGGMGLINPTQLSDLEYKASRLATSQLTEAIRNQMEKLPDDFNAKAKADKVETRKLRSQFYSEQVDRLRDSVRPDLLKAMNMAS